MEFHEKLQALRKQKGITQEELADDLYVSRTAISKWESGRGYPSIDSLKAIAKFFHVTIDELLSGEEVLTIAAEEQKQKEAAAHDLIFGTLDIAVIMLLFLPFFGQRTDGILQEVSLLSFKEIAIYLKIAYYAFVFGMSIVGCCTLALQNCRHSLWLQHKRKLSVIINVIGVFLFILGLQPYAACYSLIFLGIKVLLLLKKP